MPYDDCINPPAFMYDIEDKFYCLNCLDDDGLIKFFNGSYAPKQMGECSYCNVEFDENDDPIEIELIAVTELQILLRQFLGHSYSNAVDELSYNNKEGGYLGETYDSYDLINDVFCGCISDGLLSDFASASDDQAYTNRDYALERPAQRWLNGWDEFKNTIKHKYRFFYGQVPDLADDRHPDNPDPRDFFHYFDTAISKLNAWTVLITDIDFYRCRIISVEQTISRIDEIGPPPPENSLYTNRFSPSGIPMLYVGDDQDICLKEIDWYPEEGKKIVTGKFRLKQPVKVMDLTAAIFPEGSFDPEWIGQYHIKTFFGDMVKDMTAPVRKDGREHIDYIPTQIICEYLRYLKSDVEGICFPSSKDNSKKSYVFFWGCEQTKEFMDLINTKEELR